ncbi:MAG: hypothetical protein HLUCCA04_01825 [Oceanicaulis sp. HLUCCA04]|nr:MAG: hypothetical protein HLUCCA04_01825 [Oceanicaulis sp. HLUCCA04]
MPVHIRNFEYSYIRNNKPIFVPTGIGRRIGQEIKYKVEKAHKFDDFQFHLRRGGHVAAIHSHRDGLFFAKIDIANFFYSVSRRRVQSALARIGLDSPRFFAKWSAVKNPYGLPEFAIPYGFVQSPILASLVFYFSETANFIRSAIGDINISVYVDDISISSKCEISVAQAYAEINRLLPEDGFQINDQKLAPPAADIVLFNCELKNQLAEVQEARIAKFFSVERSPAAEEAFAAYCASVERGNLKSGD